MLVELSAEDGREVNITSPMDTFMVQVAAFIADVERKKAQLRTKDAMDRKARAGHVTGGRVFGYDNVEVFITGANGERRRSHVELRINAEEGAVVVLIFRLAADGLGFAAIAKVLNEKGAAAPRSQRGRPGG